MGFINVRLFGVPLALHVRALSHYEEVSRELALMALDSTTSPGRLLVVAAELHQRFAPFAAPAHAALEAALSNGEERVDLSYDVPAEVADAAAELGTLLDEIDEHSREGRLLVLAAPEDAISYRRWFLGEFVAQASGAAPTPWNDPQLATHEHWSLS